jgi:hypothetical protein
MFIEKLFWSIYNGWYIFNLLFKYEAFTEPQNGAQDTKYPGAATSGLWILSMPKISLPFRICGVSELDPLEEYYGTWGASTKWIINSYMKNGFNERLILLHCNTSKFVFKSLCIKL